MIHIIPGKVSNIFDAEREVLQLINNKNIIKNGDYRYAQDGILSISLAEISKKPVIEQRNTCSLQTFKTIISSNKIDKNSLWLPPRTNESCTLPSFNCLTK